MREKGTRGAEWNIPAHVPRPVKDVLRELLPEIGGALADALEGTYLYGSLAAGDFDPRTSDLDLLVVVASDIDDRQLKRLQQMHFELARSHPEWRDRIDVSYISVTALKTFKHHESPIVVISPGEPINRKETSPGWVMNWHIVREQGITLLGPSPRALIARTTDEDFVSAVRTHMRDMPTWAEAWPEVHAYAVVTACRGLYTCSTGKQMSKKGAALWAERRYPEWSSMIENALSWRSRKQDRRLGEEEVIPQALEFVRFAAREVMKGTEPSNL